jgi:DNA polymerase-3 subunit beta
MVSKAILENKIRPVISGMYIETEENKILLKGTNLELTITSQMTAEILEEGNAVFAYELVEEYLKEITDTEIIITLNDEKLTIETEDSSSEFSLFDPSEYPTIRGFQGENEYVLPREKFLELLEKSKFAAAQSPDNLAINCLRMELEEGKLQLISTDSYRLVYVSEEVSLDGNLKVSIPLRSVEALIKILNQSKLDEIKFSYEGNQIKFILGETEILSRVIDLVFPDYKGILGNNGYDKNVEVSLEDFIIILKRVQIFVRNNGESKNSGIFEFKGDTLEIKGVSEIAKINESLNVKKEGEDLRISLNVKFLLDYLSLIEKDKIIEIKMSTSSGAVELKEKDKENFRYIVMPLALKD